MSCIGKSADTQNTNTPNQNHAFWCELIGGSPAAMAFGWITRAA